MEMRRASASHLLQTSESGTGERPQCALRRHSVLEQGRLLHATQRSFKWIQIGSIVGLPLVQTLVF